jgi:hypothetical protein
VSFIHLTGLTAREDFIEWIITPTKIINIFFLDGSTLQSHMFAIWINRRWGSSVSIVSDYTLDDRMSVVRFSKEAKDFSSSICVQTNFEAHPASCTMGTGGPFPEGKVRPGRDANH